MIRIALAPKALIACSFICFAAPSFAFEECDSYFENPEWEPEDSDFPIQALQQSFELRLRDWQYRVLQLGTLMRSRYAIEQGVYSNRQVSTPTSNLHQEAASLDFYRSMNETLDGLLKRDNLEDVLTTLINEFGGRRYPSFESLFAPHPFRYLMQLSEITKFLGSATSNSYYYLTRDILLSTQKVSQLRWTFVNALEFPDLYPVAITQAQIAELRDIINFELGIVLTFKEAFTSSIDSISDIYLRMEIKHRLAQQIAQPEDDKLNMDDLSFSRWASPDSARRQLVTFYFDINRILLALINDRRDLIGDIDFLQKNEE